MNISLRFTVASTDLPVLEEVEQDWKIIARQNKPRSCLLKPVKKGKSPDWEATIQFTMSVQR